MQQDHKQLQGPNAQSVQLRRCFLKASGTGGQACLRAVKADIMILVWAASSWSIRDWSFTFCAALNCLRYAACTLSPSESLVRPSTCTRNSTESGWCAWKIHRTS